MTKSLMPGLVYASGVMLATEKYSKGVTLNMLLIAFGVLICAIGEQNLVVRGLIQQLGALGFEVGAVASASSCTSGVAVRMHGGFESGLVDIWGLGFPIISPS